MQLLDEAGFRALRYGAHPRAERNGTPAAMCLSCTHPHEPRTPRTWTICGDGDDDVEAIEAGPAEEEQRAHREDGAWTRRTDVIFVPAKQAASPGSILASALSLVHELLRIEPQHRPRLWILTTQRAGGRRSQARVGLGASDVWGFARTLALEHPDLRVVCVDLDGSVQATAMLGRSVGRPSGLETSLSCDSRRHRTDLPPCRATCAPRGFSVSPEGAYLVTGGFGGLGLEVCQWLVKRGARNLVLTGRRPPSEVGRGDPGGIAVERRGRHLHRR